MSLHWEGGHVSGMKSLREELDEERQQSANLCNQLARYREAVAVAVAALESVIEDRQENYVGSGLDDARNALAILKRVG